MDSSEYLEFKERDLKDYYEKYCFINKYNEENLVTAKYTKLLEKEYGYHFISDGFSS